MKMFVPSRLLLAGLVLLGLATAARASQNLYENGVTWQVGYEGNFLPNNPSADPAWSTYVTTGTTSGTVAGGVFTMSSAGTGIIYAEMDGPLWDGNSGGTDANTIEFRMKGLNGQANADWTARLFFGTPSFRWFFSFDDNRFFLGSSHFAIDTTVYHTYRIVSSGGLADVYIDLNTTPSLTGVAGTAAAGNFLFFGDDAASLIGTTNWDYFRFTNAGAFSDIPEPASLLLLAAGGLVMLRRPRASRRVR